MKVFVDAGHGGKNNGCWRGAIIEKRYALSIAKALRDILNTTCKHPVVMSRNGDDFLTLKDRATICVVEGCDLAVSIHINVNSDPGIKGMMTFHTTAEGKRLGDEILRSAPAPLRRKRNKSTKASPDDWTKRTHNVLRHYGETPAVLVECFFVTNNEDYWFGLSDTGRQAIINSIACGISNYQSILYEENPAKFRKADGVLNVDSGGSIRA